MPHAPVRARFLADLGFFAQKMVSFYEFPGDSERNTLVAQRDEARARHHENRKAYPFLRGHLPCMPR